MTDRIKRAFRHSVTILWARILMLFGFFVPLLADPAFSPFIADIVRALLSEPRYVAVALAVIGVVTELARRRTLNK